MIAMSTIALDNKAGYRFIMNHIDNNTITSLNGKRLWVTNVAVNRGLGLQRNLPPTEVECVVDPNIIKPFRILTERNVSLMKIGKNGRPTQQKVSMYDNAGNGIYISDSEAESTQVFNQQLEHIKSMMDRRINDIEEFKTYVDSLVRN